MSDAAQTFDAALSHLIAKRALETITEEETRELLTELENLWKQLSEHERLVRKEGLFGLVLALGT